MARFLKQAHWRDRAAGQPFFAVFNSEKSHESQIRTRPHNAIADPAKMRIPAYHPDLPEVRQDWAQYYDKVSAADADAGVRLKELAAAGLAEDTIVFYYGDHGSGMPCSKRWPSNSGLHVPMVVYFLQKWRHLAPKEYQPGGKSDRLVSFVDLAPTVLSLAGIKPPAAMQGHAFAGPFQTEPQPYLYGARGRMDERLILSAPSPTAATFTCGTSSPRLAGPTGRVSIRDPHDPRVARRFRRRQNQRRAVHLLAHAQGSRRTLRSRHRPRRSHQPRRLARPPRGP